MELISFFMGLVPAIITSIAVFYWQRAQNKRDKATEHHSDAKKRQDLMVLEMQMATAKLAFANAMAIKRGTPNGEVEEGINAYEDARKKYLDFLNEQAAEHLNY